MYYKLIFRRNMYVLQINICVFSSRPSRARMVPVRHPAANPGDGGGLPGIRDGDRPPMDVEQKSLPNTKHTGRLQRIPSATIIIHVLRGKKSK
jgi:hypothetical protein